MTNYPLTASATIPYTTPCREDHVRYGQDATTNPYRYRWGDFPETVVTRFREALLTLEQMVYAVYGSIPYYTDFPNDGDVGVQWHETLDPRTLWPWVTEYCFDVPGIPAYCKRDCLRGVWRYLAMGESDPYGLKIEVPASPIRSRSGNPVAQFKTTHHSDRLGGTDLVSALVRNRSAVNCSKSGRNDFDADSTLIHKYYPALRADAMDEPDEQALDTTITIDTSVFVPDAGYALDSVEVLYRVFDARTRSWSGETVAASRWNGTVLTASIPPQSQTRPNDSSHPTHPDQGSTVIWCLRVQFREMGNPLTVQTVYDPHAPNDETSPPPLFVSPPSTGGGRDALQARTDPESVCWPYAYVCFRHYNPYRHGLPEMWDVCRKGTDPYRFNSEEELSPALINMVRWICDTLGAATTHTPDSKRGVEGHSDTYLCCLRTPIVFYWSGSNVPDLYIPGGKSVDEDGYPDLVHNHPNQSSGLYGDPQARRSWRGRWLYWATDDSQLDAELDYADFGNLNDAHPAVGESWKTYGAILRSEREFDKDFDAWTWDRGTPEQYIPYAYRNGLRAGDVIDVVHITELIAAIESLYDNGFWVSIETDFYPRSHHRTPSGDPCSLRELTVREGKTREGDTYVWPDEPEIVSLDENGRYNGGCYHVETVDGTTYYYRYVTPDCSQSSPRGCRRCSQPAAYLDGTEWVPLDGGCGSPVPCTRTGLCYTNTKVSYSWTRNKVSGDCHPATAESYQKQILNTCSIGGGTAYRGGSEGGGGFDVYDPDPGCAYSSGGYDLLVDDVGGWFCGPPDTAETSCPEQARSNWKYGNGLTPGVYDPCSSITICGTSPIRTQFVAGSMGNKFDDLVHCYKVSGGDPAPAHLAFETPFEVHYEAPRGLLETLHGAGRDEIGMKPRSMGLGGNPRVWSADSSPPTQSGIWFPVCLMNGSNRIVNNWPGGMTVPQWLEKTKRDDGTMCDCAYNEPSYHADCHEFFEHKAIWQYTFETSAPGKPCNEYYPGLYWHYEHEYEYCTFFRIRSLKPECDIRQVWCRVQWFSGSQSDPGFEYLLEAGECDPEAVPRPFDNVLGEWGYPAGFNLVLPYGTGLCRRSEL